MPTIAIIGLGYVGLPFALQFARSGTKTIGIDIDSFKVDQLRSASYMLMDLLREWDAETSII